MTRWYQSQSDFSLFFHVLSPMKTSVMMNPADTCHYGLSGSEKTGQEVRLDNAFVVKDSPETYGWLLDC